MRGSAPLSYSCTIPSSSILIPLMTTSLPSPLHYHCTFRCRCVAVVPLITVALALTIAIVTIALLLHLQLQLPLPRPSPLPPCRPLLSLLLCHRCAIHCCRRMTFINIVAIALSSHPSSPYITVAVALPLRRRCCCCRRCYYCRHHHRLLLLIHSTFFAIDVLVDELPCVLARLQATLLRVHSSRKKYLLYFFMLTTCLLLNSLDQHHTLQIL